MTAADETLDKKTCEAFARTLFEVVEEALLTDKFVKVKGFGTFKLVAVSDRESVNINTGERFQIEGHTKVSFIPDNALKDEINRPFAHFETIDLSDDTEQAELDAIDAAAEEEAQEMQASQEAVEEAADEAVEDIVEVSVEEEPAEKAVEQTAEEVTEDVTTEATEESMEEPVATEPQTIVTAEKKEEEPAKAAASAEERQSVAEATVENTDDEAPAEETPAEESPESRRDLLPCFLRSCRFCEGRILLPSRNHLSPSFFAASGQESRREHSLEPRELAGDCGEDASDIPLSALQPSAGGLPHRGGL